MFVGTYYYMVTTITTVGYGEIVPKKINETVLAIFVELSGLAAYSLLMSGILGLKAEKSTRTLWQENLAKIESYLNSVGNGSGNWDYKMSNEYFDKSRD